MTNRNVPLRGIADSTRRESAPPAEGHKNWMVLVLIAVVWLSGLGVSPLLAQKQITVRFLDPKSGKPISKMWIRVYQYKANVPKGPIPAEYVLDQAGARTNERGEVAIPLHDPLPTFIGVISFDLWNSGPLIPLDKVLESGVVLDYSRKVKGGRPKPSAKPGEIIFVERRLTVWDRMRQELP